MKMINRIVAKRKGKGFIRESFRKHTNEMPMYTLHDNYGNFMDNSIFFHEMNAKLYQL